MKKSKAFQKLRTSKAHETATCYTPNPRTQESREWCYGQYKCPSSSFSRRYAPHTAILEICTQNQPYPYSHCAIPFIYPCAQDRMLLVRWCLDHGKTHKHSLPPLPVLQEEDARTRRHNNKGAYHNNDISNCYKDWERWRGGEKLHVNPLLSSRRGGMTEHDMDPILSFSYPLLGPKKTQSCSWCHRTMVP